MSDPEINGWKPPLIYDVMTDTKRIATQDDIDHMQRLLGLLNGMFNRTKQEIEHVDTTMKLHRPDAGYTTPRGAADHE